MNEDRNLKRKNQKDKIEVRKKGDVVYLTFPPFSKEDWLVHGFSTRLGGVSTGVLSTMNLSFGRGDERECVLENYRRISSAIGFELNGVTASDQTHTNHVRTVTSEDAGKGIVREKDYRDVDGLVTNVPGLTLATYYADCVPLFFADPMHRAVGLSHSGWRGTVSDIAGETIRRMREAYGTRPEELLGAIGPSICQDCDQVSEDVILQVKNRYPSHLWNSLFREDFTAEGEEKKYRLNLWEACRQNMIRSGMLPERIFVTDLCTCCNPRFLFSHRASQGKRGNLAAFLGIRETRAGC